MFAQIEAVSGGSLRDFCLIVGGLAASAYYIKELFWPASVPQPLSVSGTPPSAAEIVRDVKSLGHRVQALENWRSDLLDKLDDNKTELLVAGEDRARRIYAHIDAVKNEMTRNFQDAERAIGRLEGKIEK
jgi:hypothetical protein